MKISIKLLSKETIVLDTVLENGCTPKVSICSKDGLQEIESDFSNKEGLDWHVILLFSELKIDCEQCYIGYSCRDTSDSATSESSPTRCQLIESTSTWLNTPGLYQSINIAMNVCNDGKNHLCCKEINELFRMLHCYVFAELPLESVGIEVLELIRQEQLQHLKKTEESLADVQAKFKEDHEQLKQKRHVFLKSLKTETYLQHTCTEFLNLLLMHIEIDYSEICKEERLEKYENRTLRRKPDDVVCLRMSKLSDRTVDLAEKRAIIRCHLDKDMSKKKSSSLTRSGMFKSIRRHSKNDPLVEAYMNDSKRLGVLISEVNELVLRKQRIVAILYSLDLRMLTGIESQNVGLKGIGSDTTHQWLTVDEQVSKRVSSNASIVRSKQECVEDILHQCTFLETLKEERERKYSISSNTSDTSTQSFEDIARCTITTLVTEHLRDTTNKLMPMLEDKIIPFLRIWEAYDKIFIPCVLPNLLQAYTIIYTPEIDFIHKTLHTLTCDDLDIDLVILKLLDMVPIGTTRIVMRTRSSHTDGIKRKGRIFIDIPGTETEGEQDVFSEETPSVKQRTGVSYVNRSTIPLKGLRRSASFLRSVLITDHERNSKLQSRTARQVHIQAAEALKQCTGQENQYHVDHKGENPPDLEVKNSCQFQALTYDHEKEKLVTPVTSRNEKSNHSKTELTSAISKASSSIKKERANNSNHEGIQRSSVLRNESMKRHAMGVVDSIKAQDKTIQETPAILGPNQKEQFQKLYSELANISKENSLMKKIKVFNAAMQIVNDFLKTKMADGVCGDDLMTILIMLLLNCDQNLFHELFVSLEIIFDVMDEHIYSLGMASFILVTFKSAISYILGKCSEKSKSQTVNYMLMPNID